MKQQVKAEITDGVMKIVIDNPETKNGLTWEGVEQLSDSFEQFMEDDKIRVAVITGNREYFYTGGRVNPHHPGENEKYANAISRYSAAADRVTKPMIAAISGDCLKAGMGLIAKCDFAVAREGVEFGFPEVRMGGVPMMVMAETMGTMPKKRALEAFLSSWNFSAEEAYRMGLVNRVVTEDKFWDTVDEYVRVFLDTPRELIEMTRKAYYSLEKMENIQDRRKFAMEMLRTEVLTSMAETEVQYNI